MQTRAFFIKKLINVLILLLAVWTLNFFLFHMLPGDPALALVGHRIPQDLVPTLRHQFGLDKPLYEQYFISLGSTLKVQYGYSLPIGAEKVMLVIHHEIAIWSPASEFDGTHASSQALFNE